MTFTPQFPSFPTLADAISKTRRLTGSSNSFQITDYQIVQYMQSFYLYDLPAKFRSLKLKDLYTFETNEGQDIYPFNSQLYITVNQPCYCAKREIKLFTDPWNFYGVNYNWQQSQVFATGDGTTGPYSGNTTAFPMVSSFNNDPGALTTDSFGNQSGENLFFPQSRVQNFLISANAAFKDTQNITDDGAGNLIQIHTTANDNEKQYGYTYYRVYNGAAGASATPVGTIDYETGEITNLYFDTAIPEGEPITVQYNPKKLSIPLSIMFYQNQFTLAPVPDKGYTVELTCYRQPIQALLDAGKSGNPELSEWWEILSVGASKKIFEDRLDSDGIVLMDKMLKERYDIIETRTYAQIGQQSVGTIYTDQLTQNYSRGGWNAPFGSV